MLYGSSCQLERGSRCNDHCYPDDCFIRSSTHPLYDCVVLLLNAVVLIFTCSIACHLNININSDVTMQSSDDQIFSLHRKNLEFSTEGFPSSETPTAGQIVALSEPSTTLGLLFQFIYPQRYPSLEKLDFDSALVLAEAAEKYVVYAAIYACKFRLMYVRALFAIREINPQLTFFIFHSEFIDSKPNELLSFAAKHNWYFLIVRLAPLLVDVPLFELSGILPSQIYTSWVSDSEYIEFTTDEFIVRLFIGKIGFLRCTMQQRKAPSRKGVTRAGTTLCSTS